MKRYEFWLRFQWNLSLRVHLTISQHWFAQWLGAYLACHPGGTYTHLFTLENRYGFWPPADCVTVPGRQAAFLVARQRFPYRSRFNFQSKTWKIWYSAVQSATQCISIPLGKYIVEQMMHPLAFNLSLLSQMKAHKCKCSRCFETFAPINRSYWQCINRNVHELFSKGEEW